MSKTIVRYMYDGVDLNEGHIFDKVKSYGFAVPTTGSCGEKAVRKEITITVKEVDEPLPEGVKTDKIDLTEITIEGRDGSVRVISERVGGKTITLNYPSNCGDSGYRVSASEGRQTLELFVNAFAPKDLKLVYKQVDFRGDDWQKWVLVTSDHEVSDQVTITT